MAHRAPCCTATLVVLLLSCSLGAFANSDLCQWIDSHASNSNSDDEEVGFQNFDELHDAAPTYCRLEFEFYRKLRRDTNDQIKAGVLSPEAAENWVELWARFVPTFQPTIDGLTKTYKCETNETMSLYGRLMAAVAAAADNKDGLARSQLSRLDKPHYFALTAEDALTSNSHYTKFVPPSEEALSSLEVIHAPDSGIGGLAVYTVYMDAPGSYEMYARVRCASSDDQHFYVSQSIFDYPALKVSCGGATGQYVWIHCTRAIVSEVGVKRLMIKSLSKDVDVETILLLENNHDDEEMLDYLAISAAAITVGAGEFSFGDDPSFQLVSSRLSLSGSVARSLNSGESPICFEFLFPGEGVFTIYGLGRALTGGATLSIIDPPDVERMSPTWEDNFSWRALGLYGTFVGYSHSVKFCLEGANMEVAAVLVHFNPRLDEKPKSVLEGAAYQTVKFEAVCGNGVVEYAEQCEQGTTGCANCVCEPGYKPNGLECELLCGNGMVEEEEECDGSPGCSESCTCRTGFESVGSGECASLCGNGLVTGSEECDGGDHCTLNCMCESGFHSTGSGDCLPICGDGLISGTEDCDGGQGCLADCTCGPDFEKSPEGGCNCKGPTKKFVDGAGCLSPCGDVCRDLELPCQYDGSWAELTSASLAAWEAAEDTPCWQTETRPVSLGGGSYTRTSCKCPEQDFTEEVCNVSGMSNCIVATISTEALGYIGGATNVQIGQIQAPVVTVSIHGDFVGNNICLVNTKGDVDFGSHFCPTNASSNMFAALFAQDDIEVEKGVTMTGNEFSKVVVGSLFKFTAYSDLEVSRATTLSKNTFGEVTIDGDCRIYSGVSRVFHDNSCSARWTLAEPNSCRNLFYPGFHANCFPL